MRISSPRAPIHKDGTARASGQSEPTPSQPDGTDAGGGPRNVLMVDIVGGHLHIVPTGKAPGTTTAATAGVSKEWGGLPDLEVVVAKALDEERYTFGPLYTPSELDEHGEYTTATNLTKAMRAFALSGTRTVNKQHRTGPGASPVGNIVDWVVWPYAQEVELSVPGRDVRKAVLPAGTAYVGVVWSPEEWPAVKGGAVTGYSLGGRAMRVSSGEMLPPMRR